MYGLCFLEFSCLQKKLLKHNLNRSDGKEKDWLTDKYSKVKNFRKGDVAKLKTEGGMSKLLQPQNGVGLSKEEKQPIHGRAARLKMLCIYGSISYDILKRPNSRKTTVVASGHRGRGVAITGHMGTLWSDGNDLYLVVMMGL